MRISWRESMRRTSISLLYSTASCVCQLFVFSGFEIYQLILSRIFILKVWFYKIHSVLLFIFRKKHSSNIDSLPSSLDCSRLRELFFLFSVFQFFWDFLGIRDGKFFAQQVGGNLNRHNKIHFRKFIQQAQAIKVLLICPPPVL